MTENQVFWVEIVGAVLYCAVGCLASICLACLLYSLIDQIRKG